MTKATGVKYSRIVLGLFFVGLIVTAVALFGITYLGSLSLAEMEIERQTQKENALAGLVFETHLRQIENQLRTASADKNLIDAIEMQNEQEAGRILGHLGNNPSGPQPDILILNAEHHPGWLDASLAHFDVATVFPDDLLATIPSDVWQFYDDKSTSPMTLAAVIAIPITNPDSGQIVAKLVGGTVLNNSPSLLETLTDTLGVSSVAIVHEDENLASTGDLSNPANFAKVIGFLSETNHLLQRGHLYTKSVLYVDEHHHPIYVYTDEPSEIVKNTQATYLEFFVPFLIYVTLASLVAVLILNRFTAPSLSSLVKYATARRNRGTLEEYRPGRITEFNQLGSLFEEAFESVHKTNAQFRELIDDSLQGVVVHKGGTIVYANHAMMEMLDYPVEHPEELIGQSLWKIYAPFERDRLMNYHELRKRGEVVPAVYEVQGLSKAGGTVWLEQHVRLTTWNDQPSIYVTVLDISDRKEQEKLIELQSNYDLLTKLPNRNLFLDRLSQAVAQAQRSGNMAALLMVDMDRFKAINDTFGHGFGDEIIKVLGARIDAATEGNETVSRLGGDEFAVILPGCEDEWEIEHKALAILEAVARKIDVEDGRDFFLTASIGITVYPYDGQDQDGLMRQADAAMYQAKSDGGNRFRFFSRQMNERTTRMLRLETALRKAIEREEIDIHYQPIIDYQTGNIAGCEALARWNDPELGQVPPSEFIPIAEESGLIVPLGKQVLRKACQFHMACLAEGLDVNSMGVNISPRQCREDGFISSIKAILDETAMQPGNLRFEMTESVMFDDSRIDPVALLNAIKSLGVRISLDDFGTGYSSLSYLKRLPIDILKIDRSFIMDLESDKDDHALVEAIISMASKLDIEVVGEGAESRQQCDVLADLGCRLIQGFYLGKPMPARDFREYVANKPYASELAQRAG
ncbi:MAG: EAL domain-containing protein [Roseibium sp.]|uniref:EAL domain-containing protein n=1 Tax=Roseibium sp. TaxID=1936156 RepID=UPI00260F9096|nr:EAL domain-containing protein [Roseibium sp.]MCV0425377.1 EAL domain-containing protein [Roseibium sp.]